MEVLPRAPPASPIAPHSAAHESVEHFLCRGARPSDCYPGMLLPALPPALLLLLQLLMLLRSLCRRPLLPSNRPLESGPPMKRRRDRGLYLSALVCSALLAVGALASLLIGLFLPCGAAKVPPAWLIGPGVEGVAAVACAAMLAILRSGGGRLRERALVGGYAFAQTVATIVVTLCFLPPAGAGNAWLIATLWRVGACCALTLTSLWPDRLARQPQLSDDFLQPPPGAPSLRSPMARALLGQVDEAALDAASHRRNQRDVWADWLTYSSAHAPAGASINTSHDGGVGSSARPTHVSDDLPYAITCRANSVPSASPQMQRHASNGSSGRQIVAESADSSGRLTAPPRPSAPLSETPSPLPSPGNPFTPNAGSFTPHVVSEVSQRSGSAASRRHTRGSEGGGRSDGRAAIASSAARWSDPLVSVELLGHVWVPDMDTSGACAGGGMHLEFMLRTVGDEAQGARLVQRRYRDFNKLHTSLAPVAKSAGVPLPALPTNKTFGRNLSEEFAAQRQAALQGWITMVVARPPLWCEALRLFLGLGETTPSSGSATPFRHSNERSTNPFGDGSSSPDGNGGGGGSGSGGGGSGAVVIGGGAAYSAELRWIISRAQQPGCGVLTEGTGFFRANTLVKWLLVQALATSREQAVPLCEAMRRQGLIHPVGEPVPFTDSSTLYRFIPQPTVS